MDFDERYDSFERLGPDLLRARHKGLDIPVLLRMVQADDAGWEDVMRVGGTLTHLSHRHILPVNEVLRIEGQVALAMRAPSDGRSLDSRLQEGPLPLLEAVTLGEQILDALACAHAHGVTHRALSKRSVLVRQLPSGPEAFVYDFALNASSTIATGGSELGEDVRAAGALLYAMLTGDDPSIDSDPSRTNPGIPPELSALVADAVRGERDGSALSSGDLLSAWRAATDRVVPVPEVDSVAWEPSHSLGPATAADIVVDSMLPHSLDTFFGRRAEFARLRSWVDRGARLISITGLGGQGKSRLALEWSHRNADAFPGGVYRCVLTNVLSTEGLFDAVGSALSLAVLDADPQRQIARALHSRGRVLLLLDDLERANDTAPVISEWLARAPEVVALCTTRMRLRISGERELPLGSLPPEEAAAMFEDRMEAAGHLDTHALSPQVVEDLVAELDGIPLALELAARCTRLHHPSEMLARLRHGELMLGGPSRAGRQTTLARVFADQWALLSKPAKSMLLQISVFANAFTLEAARSIVQVSPGANLEMLLHQLLVAGLVVRDGPGRHRLLRSLDRFLADRTESDLVMHLVGLGHRHAEYYSALGHGDRLRQLGSDERGDLENLLQAAHWARSQGEATIAARCAVATWRLLHQFGPTSAIGSLIEDVLELPSLLPRHRGRLHTCLAERAMREGRPDAAESLVARARMDVASDPSIRDVDEYLGLRRSFVDLAITRSLDASATGAPARTHQPKILGPR